MMRENSNSGALRDGASASGVECLQMLGNRCPVGSDQNLAIRFEKQVDTLPVVGDKAGAGADGLEDAGRRGKTVLCHAVAVDIERRQAGTEKGVVVIGADVAELANVR